MRMKTFSMFPYIVNAERSGLYANAGWETLDLDPVTPAQEMLNRLMANSYRQWENVRFDARTAVLRVVEDDCGEIVLGNRHRELGEDGAVVHRGQALDAVAAERPVERRVHQSLRRVAVPRLVCARLGGGDEVGVHVDVAPVLGVRRLDLEALHGLLGVSFEESLLRGEVAVPENHEHEPVVVGSVVADLAHRSGDRRRHETSKLAIGR